MTPKILKAGLLVGALVFALVSCGQNTKPTVNLKASYTFAPDERTKRFKISDVIKDKDSDSLTLSNFTSSDPAAWITLDSESKPMYIILNAAMLPPAQGDQPGRAKVKFQVSDGTETITVSMDVIVHRPPFGCMILDNTVIVPSACALGSVHMPDTLSTADPGVTPIKIAFSKYPAFSKYATHDEDDPANFIAPDIVGGGRYLLANADPTLVDCDEDVNYDGQGGASDDEDCFQIQLPAAADRAPTPEGVTVMLELTAQRDNASSNQNTEDDLTRIIHFVVAYTS